MPSQLLSQLRRYLDQHVRSDVMAVESVRPKEDQPHPNPSGGQTTKPAANTHPHWPAGAPAFGGAITSPQSVVIHETSGWPSYASANRFSQLYRCVDTWELNDNDHKYYDKRGYGPQFFVDGNGTAFVLIGPENLAGDARLTWHGEGQNPVSLGIENSDVGDSGAYPGPASNAKYYVRLPKPGDTSNPPTQPNVPGRKLYAMLHPNSNDAALVLIWFAVFANANPITHPDPGDYKDNGDLSHLSSEWRNMLFTERNYRSLALLCRLISEQYSIPRNFLVRPYAAVDQQTNAALFRQNFLGYERRDLIATTLGLNVNDALANNAAFSHAYNGSGYSISWVDSQGHQQTVYKRSMWGRFLGYDKHTGGTSTPCFKGFFSHVINGHHPCPGPLFDWHRFSREVWDWWWYPFDFLPPGTDPTPALSGVRRPYNQARFETPLVEYFWEAEGQPADYNAKRVSLAFDERFNLAIGIPIYAMANGVVVAARMALSDDPGTPGFLLVRHEVFNTLSNNQIDFDVAPLYFWSLTTYLENTAFTTTSTADGNPDWVNRFVLRLLETEAAVAFQTANSAKAAAQQTANWAKAWDFSPGTGDRQSIGQEIKKDADKYRSIANDLNAGKAVLFPLERDSAPTPVRVLLGDFLGFPNRTPGEANGIQIEIFSKTQIPSVTTDYRASTWATQSWWKDVSDTSRHEDSNQQDLPGDGMVWHYKLTDFLKYVNGITWQNERKKYGYPDPDPHATTPVDPPVKRRNA